MKRRLRHTAQTDPKNAAEQAGDPDLSTAQATPQATAQATAETLLQVVGEVVRVRTGSVGKCLNPLRRAQNGNHLIDDMASELEHAAPGEPRQFGAHGFGRAFTDHGVEFGNGSEPAVINRLEEKHEGGVIPKHIAHLDRQPGFIGGGV